MRINNLRIFPLMMGIAFAVAALWSCGKSSEEDTTARRDSLYNDVIELTRLYTDSMRRAEDTETAEALLTHWESRLQTIYMHYPPASDRLLSEGQNDTIFELTQSLVQSYHRALSPCDSVAADSVAQDSIRVKEELSATLHKR